MNGNVSASSRSSGVGEDPSARLESHAREPGDLRDACGASEPQDGGGRLRPYRPRAVSEESHCGIVPMNHSNQDGTLVGGV